MKQKGSTKTSFLPERAFLKDLIAPIQDPSQRQRIKEAIRKVTALAEQRAKEYQAEISSLKELLREEREKRIRAQEILQKREPLLSERVKEISCFYSVVNLMGDRNYASEDQKIRDIVKLIPTGWHDPQDAYAQIILGGNEYQTDNFRETPWKQISPIFVNGESAGRLVVGYLREKPMREEGPFLLEERTLIDVLAKLLGEIIGAKLIKKLN